MNEQIKRLEVDDIEKFMELVCLFEEVFEMKDFVIPPKEHLQNLLAQKSFLVFAALQDDKVIGGITAYSMTQYYSACDAVFIYDVAVAKNMQRRGIGKKLIAELNSHCKQAGAEVTFLEADEPDEYAIEFYRSTGAVQEKGYFFSYPLNK